MLLLNNNELQHVNSSSDILEHYGVKGMKWNKRKMAQANFKYNQYKETANSRRAALGGSYSDINRAKLKRVALLGTAGPLTVNANNLSKSAARYDKKAARVERKAAKLAGKEAWTKALDDKKLNRQIETTWRDYDRVDKEKVGLFDRNGRKDKKKRLNDLHKTGSMLEDKLFEKAEKAKKKATKKL